jgi:hypothetical protein
MVYMAGRVFQVEVPAAGFDLAISAERRGPMTSPPLARWAAPGPLPVEMFPAYLLFPGAEARLAEKTLAATIGAVAAIHGFEHCRASVTTMWTKHIFCPPFLGIQERLLVRRLSVWVLTAEFRQRVSARMGCGGSQERPEAVALYCVFEVLR